LVSVQEHDIGPVKIYGTMFRAYGSVAKIELGTSDVRQSQGDLAAGLGRAISLADLAALCLHATHWRRQHMGRA
jgi:hypothetical protein